MDADGGGTIDKGEMVAVYGNQSDGIFNAMLLVEAQTNPDEDTPTEVWSATWVGGRY